MEIKPYSIYTDHRPFRIAFLVDPKNEEKWFDQIIKYNRGKWGGRFNPIIFTDGKTIESSWWNFLEEYDPDIIFSTVELDGELLKKINIFLTPLEIRVINSECKYIDIDHDPISILPTQENLKTVSRDFLDDRSSLIIFEVDESSPSIIKTFLSRNFGLLGEERMRTYHLKRCLDSCKIKTYKISDFDSLNKSLLDLGEDRTLFTFPAQVCSLPNNFKDTSYNYDNEKFAVIVGDSFDELVYLWNRTIGISNWMRTFLTHIWLPKEIAENEIIRPGLGKFINRYTSLIGNNNQHGVSFETFSLTEEEIKDISKKFDKLFWHPKTAKKFNNPILPDFKEHIPIFYLKRNLELYRAHSQEEHIIINEPNVKQGGIGGQYWFTDLYIQFRPEKFSYVIGQDYWWQLPKRNSILYNSHIFNKPARINENGTFSVLMRRKTGFDPDENILIIKIPEDRSIFYSLFCGESYDCYHKDNRKRFLSRPFYTIRRSDKGMYLSGIISLFPNLFNAHSLVEGRYWRKIFEKMSNYDVDKESGRVIETKNVLKKSIGRGRDFNNSEEDLDWLSNKVLILSKSFVKKEVDLRFIDFVDLGVKETEEYNSVNKSNQFKFDEVELISSISDLIEMNVILLGVKPRCPRCGYKIWYHINETTQKINCKGCSYDFTIKAQEEWYYRLNSLVRSAFVNP